MKFVAEYPDGRKEIILDVPRYEFDWQNLYVVAEPKLMPEGTILHCEGHFDNSANNPNNPNPKRKVFFGEQTEDEMLVGYLNFSLMEQDLALGGPTVKPLENGRSEVTFRYKPDSPSKTVKLVGTFTDWKDKALKMDGPDKEGRYSAKVVLGPGTHEYKYLLEGDRYREDPGNPEQMGIFHNSVVRLEKP